MRRVIVIVGLFTLLNACDTTIVKSSFKALNGAVWEKDEVVEFTISELDSTTRYDVYINVRNDNSFAYNNLFLIAELASPEGTIQKDTLEYEMANADGSWLGKGYGSIKENRLWYKENIIFPAGGAYTLRFTHAMRKNGNVEGIERLEGITDVGYEIVKSKQ